MFFFASRRRHTRCSLVTGVHTCALPICSVAFREGIITAKGDLRLAPEPPFATATDARGEEDARIEGPVTVFRHQDATLSGTVIFPITKAQANGLEDLRLVKFTHDDGSDEWLGTYTAYSGRERWR